MVTVNPPLGKSARGSAEPPVRFALAQNAPNPFNARTVIAYTLPPGKVRQTTLLVYNLRGEVVKTLVEGPLDEGRHRIEWDGTDAAGKPVPSGVYFYQLHAGEFSAVRKLSLLK